MESETALQIRRIFSAPREKVYEAWTKKEQFGKWFAPHKEFKTVIHEFDVRTDGKYRVELRSPDGKISVVRGTYREVIPSQRLVFSWFWETDEQYGETEVTLEFLESRKGTELVLTHRLLPSREAREEHNKGWSGCLDGLRDLLLASPSRTGERSEAT